MSNNWNGEWSPKVGEWFIDIEYSEDKPVECIALTKHHIVYKTSDEIKDIEYFGCILSECRVIPNKKEIAKQKAVEEMLNSYTEYKVLRSDYKCELECFAENLVGIGYHNGKKLKPLPKDWYKQAFDNGLNFTSWLIENGHCIGSAD